MGVLSLLFVWSIHIHKHTFHLYTNAYSVKLVSMLYLCCAMCVLYICSCSAREAHYIHLFLRLQFLCGYWPIWSYGMLDDNILKYVISLKWGEAVAARSVRWTWNAKWSPVRKTRNNITRIRGKCNKKSFRYILYIYTLTFGEYMFLLSIEALWREDSIQFLSMHFCIGLNGQYLWEWRRLY